MYRVWQAAYGTWLGPRKGHVYCQQQPKNDGGNPNDGTKPDAAWVVRESISSQHETVDAAGLFGLFDLDEERIPVREQMRLDSGADSAPFLKWVMRPQPRKKDYIRASIEGALSSLANLAKRNKPQNDYRVRPSEGS